MHRRPRRTRRWTVLACAVAVAVAASAWLTVAAGPHDAGAARAAAATLRPSAPAVPHVPSTAPTRAAPVGVEPVHGISDAQLAAAARYAQARGYTAGLAVVDTVTGATFTGGADGLYSTESVSKLFIAARLLVEGGMTGSTADAAYAMITRSDDDAANALYGTVGGDAVLDWVEEHYDLPDLGTPPSRPNWWGLFHVRPSQLALLLDKLRHDPAVWPWLGSAMAHATRVSTDGFDQSFGLRQVDPKAAMKQGWERDYSLPGSPAQLNTTGFVDGGRYAVVVMVRGPNSTYFAPIAAMVTQVTRLALTGRA